jgi:eukaryotic-like serine/threonine-protein kinase
MWKSAPMSASQLPTARVSTRTRVKPATRDRASSRSPAPLALERYRLQKRLGAGGFGTVWMAWDERLEREVAVKIVPRERIISGRLEREARAAARLSHPAIITLYEAAVDDEGAYLVSELVRGPTLDELLDAGRLSDRDVIEIGIALCEALAHAHSQGVVHRDVKPSNVLVPEQPTTRAGLAKLTDFGVARVVGGDSLTKTGDVLGTAAYMAPEQAEGLDAGAPADLYSLALVLYEALTGVNPIRTTTAALRARRLGAHVPPLRRQRRELPRELGCAIDLALRPKARERGTIEELRAALVEAHAVAGDTPGIVTGGWSTRPRPATEEPEPFAAQSEPANAEELEEDSIPLPTSARFLAALAAGAATAWIVAHALAPAPIAPVALGLIAMVAVAMLPRIGWLAMMIGIAAGAAAQSRPGPALLILIIGLSPVPLLPLAGTAWPLAAGAPALGILGLGGAWPALAARTGGPWRRAALGAVGWIWLALAAPLNGTGLYLSQYPASPLKSWGGSLTDTIDVVLRPLLSSGVLAAAPVWALAALIVPWLVRGRSLARDIVLVTIWAATSASATIAAIQLVRPGQVPLSDGTAVLGAVAAAIIVLAPGLLRAARASA